jgi:hypothetical protein
MDSDNINNNSRQNWFESNPKKTIAIVIIISFLAIDFGTAALLKTIGKFRPSFVSSSVRESYYRKRHPVYHHGLAPNINAYRATWGPGGFMMCTNSLGFKDASPRKVALYTNKKRILIIGDSFTEGAGVEYSQTFAGRLQQHYPAIEFLNAAVSSYSPIIYYRKIKYLLEDINLKFDEVWVFIDVSDIEDEALDYTFDDKQNVISRGSDEIATQQKLERSFREFFTQNTFFLARLRNVFSYFNDTLRPWDRALNNRHSMWTINEETYQKYGKKGTALATQHMTLLKTLLDKYNIKLTIGIYPWPDQVYHKDLNSRQVIIWQNWATQHKVKLFNMFPAFINLGNPKKVIMDYYIAGDVHFNKKGHELVFDTIRTMQQ